MFIKLRHFIYSLFCLQYLLTCDRLLLNVDTVLEAGIVAADGEGVQLMSVSFALSADIEEIELFLTPGSWLVLVVGGINAGGAFGIYADR